MTYASPHRDFDPNFDDKASTRSNAVANKAGVLRRIFEAIFESRHKQTNQDMARFLARSGGRLTDDIERVMTQRLLTGHWNARR